MAFCDFCTCNDCRKGNRGLIHAMTADNRWICDVCWRYDVCVSEKRKSGVRDRPCETLAGRAIPGCPHRPKLVTGWIGFEPNEGHYHEVMDRASMLLDIWCDQIQDLVATKSNEMLREAAEVVERAMSNFYQVASQVHQGAKGVS